MPLVMSDSQRICADDEAKKQQSAEVEEVVAPLVIVG